MAISSIARFRGDQKVLVSYTPSFSSVRPDISHLIAQLGTFERAAAAIYRNDRPSTLFASVARHIHPHRLPLGPRRVDTSHVHISLALSDQIH
ncbi:hypothetical protein EIK56_02730 [Sphingomonas sp. C8-2]|uniref:hypothetical protein n=1 Tax=Rhizorhabdus histidinilytica TaxID=439228 RepID=UPI000F79E796|nr:hypothetical protein EIK56_02730 [Sphingomonas sp. C8-2]